MVEYSFIYAMDPLPPLQNVLLRFSSTSIEILLSITYVCMKNKTIYFQNLKVWDE